MIQIVCLQVQFAVVITHILNSIYQQCGYPLGYSWLLAAFMISLVVLFMNFYLKAYTKPKVANGSVSNKSKVANGSVSISPSGDNRAKTE